MELEQPLYVLKPKKSRIIIPKIILVIFLSLIFYVGVVLNLFFLELEEEVSDLIKIITLIILIFLIVLGFFLSYRNTLSNYLFYPNRIELGKEGIFLFQIEEVEIKTDFLDKIFKTYSLVLKPKFKINYIPQEIEIKDYTQQLIVYAKAHQRQQS